MADKVGASPQAMADAVRNFNTRYNQFITASQNITSDTLALQAAWQGQGYDEFTTAMGKWHTDITNVTTDLQSMSLGVNNSSSAIIGTDNNIAKAFRGFQG